MTRNSLHLTDLYPNDELRVQIQSWCERHGVELGPVRADRAVHADASGEEEGDPSYDLDQDVPLDDRIPVLRPHSSRDRHPVLRYTYSHGWNPRDTDTPQRRQPASAPLQIDGDADGDLTGDLTGDLDGDAGVNGDLTGDLGVNEVIDLVSAPESPASPRTMRADSADSADAVPVVVQVVPESPVVPKSPATSTVTHVKRKHPDQVAVAVAVAVAAPVGSVADKKRTKLHARPHRRFIWARYELLRAVVDHLPELDNGGGGVSVPTVLRWVRVSHPSWPKKNKTTASIAATMPLIFGATPAPQKKRGSDDRGAKRAVRDQLNALVAQGILASSEAQPGKPKTYRLPGRAGGTEASSAAIRARIGPGAVGVVTQA